MRHPARPCPAARSVGTGREILDALRAGGYVQRRPRGRDVRITKRENPNWVEIVELP
jgi:hypothetical protein